MKTDYFDKMQILIKLTMFICILTQATGDWHSVDVTTFLPGVFSTLAEAQTAMLAYYYKTRDDPYTHYHDDEKYYNPVASNLYILEITLGKDSLPNYTRFEPPPLPPRTDDDDDDDDDDE